MDIPVLISEKTLKESIPWTQTLRLNAAKKYLEDIKRFKDLFFPTSLQLFNKAIGAILNEVLNYSKRGMPCPGNMSRSIIQVLYAPKWPALLLCTCFRRSSCESVGAPLALCSVRWSFHYYDCILTPRNTSDCEVEVEGPWEYSTESQVISAAKLSSNAF